MTQQSAEYKRGYAIGFDDQIYHWWQLRNCSPEFQRGYRDGKAEIDRLVDEEAQSRCFDNRE